jgi:hypothetical protein
MPSCGSISKSARSPIGIALRVAHAALAIKLIKHIVRERHLPDHAALAALEGSDTDNAALDVDRRRREREHFRDARAA